MRTALRMYNDMERRGYNPGLSKEKCLPLFEKIIGFLDPDERVSLAFLGKYEGKWTPCVVSNKRIIIITGKSGFLGTTIHASFIDYSNLSTISWGETKKSQAIGLETKNLGLFLLEVKTGIAEYLPAAIQEAIMKNTKPATQKGRVSSAKEIERFKKLLDDGVITQEEFEIQKQKLLNT